MTALTTTLFVLSTSVDKPRIFQKGEEFFYPPSDVIIRLTAFLSYFRQNNLESDFSMDEHGHFLREEIAIKPLQSKFRPSTSTRISTCCRSLVIAYF